MSENTATVERYLDGFRRNDHAQILFCLTDDIEWTVFGAFHLTGEVMRMSMAEVFVMRAGQIAERRAWVIELKENDVR
jgi:ketosteroid isomerase-like protein